AEYYTNSKLFIRRVGKNLECVFDDNGFFSTHVLYVGIQKDSSFGLKAIMCILNSTLFNYLYQTLFPAKGDIFPEIRIGNLRSLPINNNIKKKSNELESLGEKLMVLYSRLDQELHKFYSSLELDNISNKIKKFYTINFDEFIKELQKSKKINFKNKLEERNFKEQWQGLFERDKTIAINLEKQILQMQANIDEIIFDSFELDKDEREYILNGK
ncbi:TaqI-like C-terminal specificity domain-containing protein, partial [uncultured Campylobacter sp.]